MHLRMLNFNSFGKNIKNITKSTFYLMDDKNYNPHEEIPNMPFPIKLPKERCSKSKKEINKSSLKE